MHKLISILNELYLLQFVTICYNMSQYIYVIQLMYNSKKWGIICEVIYSTFDKAKGNIELSRRAHQEVVNAYKIEFNKKFGSQSDQNLSYLYNPNTYNPNDVHIDNKHHRYTQFLKEFNVDMFKSYLLINSTDKSSDPNHIIQITDIYTSPHAFCASISLEKTNDGINMKRDEHSTVQYSLKKVLVS
jgi:hypothetical protein